MNARTWNERIREYMEQHRMAEPGDRVLAAVSGGADSVCLLLVLKALSENMAIDVEAFHLNHGIRGDEADRDEAYVKELCKQLEVPLTVVREDVRCFAKEHGLSEEEAGRTLRYRHLEKTAGIRGCHRIATAHHKDDQVETVLMNLFRGSGFRGIGGIRPVRTGESGTVIRPLLCMGRKEIEAYLKEVHVSWCEDSTNQESDYARNKVRNVLIPWVRENLNEQMDEHVIRIASFSAQADAYFTAQAEQILEEAKTETPDSVGMDVKRFDGQPDIMKPYLIRAMIMRLTGSMKDLSARHLEAVCGLNGPGGGTKTDLPYGLQAVRSYDRLMIRRAEKGRNQIKPEDSDHRKERVTVHTRVFPYEKSMEFPKNQYTKWFDYDKIKGTLSVRTRESGDYITIGSGKTKKLNRFFIDEKIPEEVRDEMMLVAEGSHILWIIGHRISEYYKISDGTRMIMEVRADKGETHG